VNVTLDQLIRENLEDLVDHITKDAVRQIPSYREAPLSTTVERVENWLRVLATSLHENSPQVLEKYIVTIAHERYSEGYQVTELHNIMQLTEQHLRQIINRTVVEPLERNALIALCEAAMDAARMVISVTYILITSGKAQPVEMQHGKVTRHPSSRT
jgi:DNA-binding transcriptional regulator YbjK